MKYRSGCVANLPPIRTLEQFLVDGEEENLVNFAELLGRTIVRYRATNGDVRHAIKYQDLEVEGIPAAVCKRRNPNGTLGQFVLLDPVSGSLMMDEQKTIKTLKRLFETLVEKKGPFRIKRLIHEAQQKDTQETLLSETLNQLEK